MTALTKSARTTASARAVWLLAGAVAVAALCAWVAYRQHHDWLFWMMDFDVYRLGADTVLHGGALYDVTTSDGIGFTYSPVVAVLFLPTLLMTPAVWTAVEVLCLELAIWVTLGAAGVRDIRPRAAVTAVLTFGALFSSPVDSDLSLGQVNLLLMFVVLVDLLHGRRWQGIGVGVAAAFKLTPLIFVVYLALTGRRRAALNAVGAFAVCVAAGFALFPGDSMRYWGGGGLSPDRMGAPQSPFNQSLRGVLGRLTHSAATINPVWLVVAVVVGCVGLVVAVHAHRGGRTLRGVLVCALTACLVSPVSWEHHWVWTIPLIVLLGADAWRSRSVGPALLALLATAAYGLRLLDWFVPQSDDAVLHLGAGPQLAGACFVLAGLVLVVALWLDGRRADVAGAL